MSLLLLFRGGAPTGTSVVLLGLFGEVVMLPRGESATLTYTAWNTSTNAPQASDAANHTIKFVRDGVSATPAASPANVSGATGQCSIAANSKETNCRSLTLSGTSSTANVVIIPKTYTFTGLAAGLPDSFTKIFDLGSSDDELVAIDVAPDGKIVAVGYVATGTTDFAVARFNPDGTLDATFNASGTIPGVATLDFSTDLDGAQDVKVLKDGSVIAAGIAVVSGNYRFACAKYKEDGTLDTTFGTSGKTTVTFGGAVDACYRVAIQSDGKIVLAGSTGATISTGFPAVCRLTAAGALDTSTFGTSGKYTSTTLVSGGSNYTGYGLMIQSTGKIVVAGNVVVGGVGQDLLYRLNAAGALDSAFGTSGVYHGQNGGAGGNVNNAILDASDRVYLTGNTSIGVTLNPNYGRVTRYTAAGAVDTTYAASDAAGISGTCTWQAVDDDQEMTGLAFQPDGKLVCAGFGGTEALQNFRTVVVRLTPDGALDSCWGRGGIYSRAVGSFDAINDCAVIPGRGILVAGYVNIGGYDWMLMLLPDNAGDRRTLDPSGADQVLVAGKTLPHAIQIIGAVVAGQITTASTSSEIFADFSGVTCVTVTADTSGNRSAVVYAV
jgi:uncharacterized delta-60 repeat protein